MPHIRIDLASAVVDGQALTFRSPADCSQVEGLKVYYPENGSQASKTFNFTDAHGNIIEAIDLFAADVLVKVILDTDLNKAYVQNADTNAYLEAKFESKAPAGYIDIYHSYTNLSDVELNKMLLTDLCNMDSTGQHRCIVNVNEEGLALDRGYWFFETTRKGRFVQMQGRLGSKLAFRIFNDSMLYNGFFEAEQKVPGWTAMSSMPFISSEHTASGKYALKVYDNRTDAGAQMHSDPVIAVEGEDYTATVKVLGEAGGETPQLWIWFYGEGGELLAKYPASTTLASSGTWQSITLTKTAPTGTKTATVVLATPMATTGTVYFDDATLSKAGGTNLLKNPGFEKYVAVPGWTANNRYKVFLTSENIEDENGRYCVKFIDESASSGLHLWSEKVAVSAGTQYTASTRICGKPLNDDTPISGSVYIYIRFFDKDGTRISQHMAGLNPSGEAWEDISITYTAPANAINADVLVCTANDYIGIVYFDNVTLTAEGDVECGFSEWSLLDAAVTPSVYSGKGEPSDDLGKDGDIYIQFEE